MCHVPDLLGQFVDLSLRSQQGLERKHGDQKLTMRTAVSQGPGLSEDRTSCLSNFQLMQRDYRKWLMEDDPDRYTPDMYAQINEDEDRSNLSDAVDEAEEEDDRAH